MMQDITCWQDTVVHYQLHQAVKGAVGHMTAILMCQTTLEKPAFSFNLLEISCTELE